MIIEHIEGLEDILKINSIDFYPQIEGILAPAAEAAIAASVGAKWVEENEADPEVKQLFCALLAMWFDKPEMLGELTPGCNFLISQLQARALEV